MALKGRAEALGFAGLLLLAGVFAVQLAGNWWGQLDLTRDARHTLAPITVDLLRRGPVEVHAFLPSRMPAPWSARVQATHDMLRRYRSASGGLLSVVLYDPGDPDLTPAQRAAIDAKARSFGIEEASVSVVEGARQRREARWFGLALLHADRQVVVPPIERIDTLEFALTRRLRRLHSAGGRPPRIGLSQGHGEPNLLESPFAGPLGASGELVNVDVGVDLLPPNLDALVVFAPQKRFSARARFVIEQHLLQGKAVALFLDYRERSAVLPDVLVPITSGLEPLIAGTGLIIDTDRTIYDPDRHVPAPIDRASDGQVRMAHHPAFVLIDGFARHPITAGLSRLVMPMASPIDLAPARAAGHEVAALITSAASSKARFNLAQYDPKALAEVRPDEPAGPFTLAAVVEGTFRSTFEAPPPRPADAPVDPRTGAPDPPPIEVGHGPGRLLVVTSGRRMLAAGGDAGLLLQSAVDWAVTATDLTALRTRRAEEAPLRPTTAREQAWLKAANVLGPVLLLGLLGLIVAWRRRR